LYYLLVNNLFLFHTDTQETFSWT